MQEILQALSGVLTVDNLAYGIKDHMNNTLGIGYSPPPPKAYNSDNL